MSSMLWIDPEEPYTKCAECGLWDDMHTPTCLRGAKAEYVGGGIEVDELESRVAAILEGES